MKKTIITILFLAATIDANSQMWKHLPLSKISDSLYIDETEVTIKDWVMYLSDIIYYDPQINLDKYLPDTNKVKKECLFYLRPFFNPNKITFRLNDTPYRPQVLFFPQIYPSEENEKYFEKTIPMSEVPITGITFDQAMEYCIWRTKKINSALSKYNYLVPKEYANIKVKVRLITPNEFVKYSSLYGFRGRREIKDKDFQKSYSIDSIVAGEKCMAFYYKSKNDCVSFTEKYGSGVMPVASFFSTFLTTYDWFGNAAEMTSEKGIAKGGSLFHFAKEANPLNNIIYKNAEEWLGFRCVIQVE